MDDPTMLVSTAVRDACRTAAQAVAVTPLEPSEYVTGVDPVYDHAPSFFLLFSLPEIHALNTALLEDPAFRAVEASTEPFGMWVAVENGGGRLDKDSVATGLFASAARSIYFSGKTLTVDVLTGTAIEHCERFARALAGGPLTVDTIHGLAGIVIEDPVATPWGTLVKAPVPDAEAEAPYQRFRLRKTTALLVLQEDQHVTFTEEDDRNRDADARWERIHAEAQALLLLQLSCALAAPDDGFLAPEYTFATDVVPFNNGGGAMGMPPLMDRPSRPVVITVDIARGIEHWAAVVEASYSPTMLTSVRRILAAINGFRDLSDSLIDAVTVWETLVGVDGGETVFRVTAALAHLLEPDLTKREELWQQLRKVYNTRSRIVHGDTVDPKVLAEHRNMAVRIALGAIRELLTRGPDWTGATSKQRSIRLLITN
jgi:hypothetical protein